MWSQDETSEFPTAKFKVLGMCESFVFLFHTNTNTRTNTNPLS